jgi:hypothetical protein
LSLFLYSLLFHSFFYCLSQCSLSFSLSASLFLLISSLLYSTTLCVKRTQPDLTMSLMVQRPFQSLFFFTYHIVQALHSQTRSVRILFNTKTSSKIFSLGVLLRCRTIPGWMDGWTDGWMDG